MGGTFSLHLVAAVGMSGRHGFSSRWEYPLGRWFRASSSTAPIWKGAGSVSFESRLLFFIVRFGIRYAIIFALNAISRAASLAVRPAGSS